MRLKYFKYFHGALTSRKGITWGSVLHMLHNPLVTISRPHALTRQSSVAVTQLHTNCSSLYLRRRDGSQSQAGLLRGSNPDLLYSAHMSERAAERQTL